MEEQTKAPESSQTSATDLAASVQHRNDVLVASLVGRVTGSSPAAVRDEHFRSSSQQHLCFRRHTQEYLISTCASNRKVGILFDDTAYSDSATCTTSSC